MSTSSEQDAARDAPPFSPAIPLSDVSVRDAWRQQQPPVEAPLALPLTEAPPPAADPLLAWQSRKIAAANAGNSINSTAAPPAGESISAQTPNPQALDKLPNDEKPLDAHPLDETVRRPPGVPSWLASMAIHMAAMIVLALVPIFQQIEPPRQPLTVAANDLVEPLDAVTDEPEFEIVPELIETDLQIADDAFEAESTIVDSLEDDMPSSELTATSGGDLDELLADFQGDGVGVDQGDELSGRGAEARADLVRRGGGNEHSERAVALALKWLDQHQSPDGGWSFDHTHSGGCNGRCGNAGKIPQARNAATALAILPFLGAGYSHQNKSEYRQVVFRGLKFLADRQDPETGSLYERPGQLYSHGLAAIALCEAYAMTKDRKLRPAAQKSIDFIVVAQHEAGGWRYEPKERGDTSVVGWQLMALKSAKMSYLSVPTVTVRRANEYLDSVQDGKGGYYGYLSPGKRLSTSAIGLLCRMYLGWSKDHPGLQEGIRYLDRQGFSEVDLYYDYYATQTLHHWGGDEWRRWNAKMRDWLVAEQSRNGHERGSWFIDDPKGSRPGGRLYSTAMATMMLEVYYRHLPIYRQQNEGDRLLAK